jgi:hypothetical protein
MTSAFYSKSAGGGENCMRDCIFESGRIGGRYFGSIVADGNRPVIIADKHAPAKIFSV